MAAPLADTKLLITIDSNVFKAGIDGKDPVEAKSYSDLLRMHINGEIDLGISSRLKQDVERDREHTRAKDELDKARRLTVVEAPFRLGVDDLGLAPLMDEELAEIYELFQVDSDEEYSNGKRNTQIDCDHLAGHVMAKRDVFLTRDIRILNKQITLERKFGVVVVSPEVFLRIRHGL